MKKNDGFILLILFLFIVSLLSAGTIILHQVVQGYHVAQYQYRYYQKKYLIEGFLFYAIDRVMADFDSYESQEVSSFDMIPWVEFNGKSYNGNVVIKQIKGKCSHLFIRVSLVTENKELQASCALMRTKNVYHVDAWKLY
jgi:hypothetical protein